jgi:cystathionine beta-lyase/cystathionine gamma-synthase
MVFSISSKKKKEDAIDFLKVKINYFTLAESLGVESLE